jgi:hypothetical protein
MNHILGQAMKSNVPKTRHLLPLQLTAALLFAAINSELATCRAQGSLTPPGAPGPTMKSLAQIEPRVDITTLPGNAYCQYLITNSGAYYLTGNITGVAGKCAIRIEADYVSLDLGGFVLRGVDPVFSAIQVTRAQRGITIENGTLTGWGGGGVEASQATESRFGNLRILDNAATGYATGLQVGSNCLVSSVTASGNDYYGIYAGERSLVSDCIVRSNRLVGLYAGGGSQVRNCQASQNVGGGIRVGGGGTLECCGADANGDHGLQVLDGGTATRCRASGNTNVGIFLGSGGVATSCAAQANGNAGIAGGAGSVVIGCSAISNRTSGISMGAGAVVRDCVARQNLHSGIFLGNGGGGAAANNECTANGSGGSDAGIHLQGTCRAEGNHVVANNPYGIVTTGSGSVVIRNTATANTNGYSFASGTTYGPIQTGTGAITNLNPWANFSY